MGTESWFIYREPLTSCSVWKRARFTLPLHRMEQSGWLASEWALTETNRRAKYYRLSAAGRKHLLEAEKNFEQLVKGVRAILRYA